MLNVSQDILNQVSQETSIEYMITKYLFQQSQDNVDQALQELIKKFEPEFQAQNPDCPAGILAMWFLETLPLYLDNQAISNYISRTEDLQLFQALPEIWSPEEAVEIISKETTLSDKDKAILLVVFQNSKKNFPKIR